MCGIAGLIGGGWSDADAVIRRMMAALEHRGPDGAGTYRSADGHVTLGHRRLSIVDPACGQQPMANEDGSVHVVFNGEIYNCRELRAELERAGHHFRSNADTEVLVHGWEEWGDALFPRLNGIYAFAILDERTGRSLILARDPAGVKPLYLGRHAHGWWFASELNAARRAGLVPSALNHDALAQYLVYRFIPSPLTPFQSVWKLPPAHVTRLRADGHAPEFSRFAHVFTPASLPGSPEEWSEAIRDELRAAVSRQLMSDVPVGSLLSGGVDSVAVTRLMHDADPDGPHAFAIGFPSPDGGGELANARRAAEALGVPLTGVVAEEREYLAAWPRLLHEMGEPIANSGLLLVGQLCGAVRRTHKVVLSGQGADEPLGGYPRHAAERLYPIARRLAWLLKVLPEGSASSDRIGRLRRMASARDDAGRFAEILAVFAPAEAGALTRRDADIDMLVAPVRHALRSIESGDRLNRLLAVDARLSLADDLLTVADHMSMKHSVELRVPFLDLPLLALMERMPGRYKISLIGERKWLYRRAVTPLIPRSLRRSLVGPGARTTRKLGFATPMDRWFREWVASDAQAMLLGSGARLTDIVRPEAIARVLGEAAQGRPRARQLMSLYALESWLQGTRQEII